MRAFEDVMIEMTDWIYQGVLGLTREEVIEEATKLAGREPISDEDEFACEYMSEEAVKAISDVEGVLADFMTSYGIPEHEAVLETAKAYRVNKVWND